MGRSVSRSDATVHRKKETARQGRHCAIQFLRLDARRRHPQAQARASRGIRRTKKPKRPEGRRRSKSLRHDRANQGRSATTSTAALIRADYRQEILPCRLIQAFKRNDRIPFLARLRRGAPEIAKGATGNNIAAQRVDGDAFGAQTVAFLNFLRANAGSQGVADSLDISLVTDFDDFDGKEANRELQKERARELLGDDPTAVGSCEIDNGLIGGAQKQLCEGHKTLRVLGRPARCAPLHSP